MTATSSARLADRISQAVLEGEFPPGTRLDEAGLALRYGLSRTPVREALTELCNRGLATRKPYRGVEVIAPDRATLRSRFEAMAELEALCASLAAHRITLEGCLGLEELIAQMEGATPAEYAALNARFHDLICTLSQNEELVRIARDLRLRVEVIRRLQLVGDSRQSTSLSEHRAIANAICAREADLAARLMRDHLRRTATRVLAMLSRGETTSGPSLDAKV